MNVIDGFLLHAKHQQTAAAICAPGWNYDIVSYGRLLVFANNAAAHALAAGLKRGNVVGIFARDPIFHWALVIGLTRVGIISFSLHDTNVPTGFAIDAVLSEAPIPSKTAARFIRVDQSWVEGDGNAPAADIENVKDAVARIILTSGTTGDQKAVALTHDLIWRRVQTYDFAFGNRFPACSRIFVDVGIAANSGYLWPIYILSRGGTVFVRGSDPAETLQALSLYGVQGMVAPPSGMAEFLDYYEQSPAFLCPFNVMLSVGSKLATSLSDRVRARMCSYVVHGYGATEGNPVAGAYVHQTAHIKGAVGYITPGMIVQAVDDNGKICAPGTEGHIRFRGDKCVTGYVGNPPGSEKFFRDGWFYPGDIGAVTADGLLIITGRSKNIIDLGGDKINPEVIESVLLSCPGVVQAVAIGHANALGIEQVWAAVETRAEVDPESIRAHCARRLAPELVPAKVTRVAAMPRNVGGKIDRDEVRKLLGSD
ncbi:MAG TPA: long-chain fatty acid--CoA ligase [Pseudolabrys sp.]|nr:long-chain fatty acid--CoA ligase [Pseudolabrys sp.]